MCGFIAARTIAATFESTMSPAGINVPQREWKTTMYFQPFWIDKIKKFQNKLLLVSTIESNKDWFEYLFDKAEPAQSRYRLMH